MPSFLNAVPSQDSKHQPESQLLQLHLYHPTKLQSQNPQNHNQDNLCPENLKMYMKDTIQYFLKVSSWVRQRCSKAKRQELSLFTPWSQTMGGKVQLLLFLTLALRWRWVVNCMPLPRYHPTKEPLVPNEKAVAWAQSHSGHLQENKTFFWLCQESNPRSYSTLSMLSWMSSWDI
jgi:hypothetical protein